MKMLFNSGCGFTEAASVVPYALSIPLFLLLLAMLGRPFADGTKGSVSSPLFCGWGFSLALLIPVGICMGVVSSWAFGALGLAALASFVLYRRDRQTMTNYSLLFAALVSQVWVYAFIIHEGVNGWDDISHWMLNALYLWQHHAFPSTTTDTIIYSVWPGYPQAMPLLQNMYGFLNGAFVVAGGGALVWGLHAALALWLSQSPTQAATILGRFAAFFFALVFLTILSPVFNASFTLTGQSDGPTTIVVGVVGLLLMQFYESLKQTDSKETRSLSIQLTLCAILLVSLRQTNIFFLLLMLGAIKLLLIRDAFERKRLSALTTPLLWLAPAFLAGVAYYFMWKSFADTNLPRTGFSILPLESWRWDLWNDMIHAVWKEALKKNGTFLLFIGIGLYGGYSFFKRKDGLGALAFMTLVVGLGQFAFLLLAYMGSSFSEAEIKRAASFYRYMVHVGMLPTIVGWFLLRNWLEKRATRRKTISLLVFSLCLIPIIHFVKPAWLYPRSSDLLCANRQEWHKVAERLSPRSNLLLLAAENPDLTNITINLELGLNDATRGSSIRHLAGQTIQTALKEQSGSGLIDDKSYNALYLIDPNEEILKRLKIGLPAPRPKRLLLQREGDGWMIVP